MEYVVMAIFDEDTNQYINRKREQIGKIAKKELAGTWIPHITLGVYKEDKIDDIIKYTKDFSLKRKKIYTSFDSIGQFLHNQKYLTTDVFYLMPASTQGLLEMYTEYHAKYEEQLSELGQDYRYINGTPTIHCSLAICDVDSYVEVISFLHRDFKQKKIEIIGIQIADMNKNVVAEYLFEE